MANVLIVDDSADMRDFCELIANMNHLKVHQSANADEALALLENGVEPDVVMLDLMMPGKKPEEFVKNLRSNPKFADTKVVIMSSLRDGEEQARAMGAQGWLRKPFDLGKISEALNPQAITAGPTLMAEPTL